jgi:DNA-binding CsgD family transcriptional regulator
MDGIVRVIQDQWGLTPAEAAVMSMINAGYTLAEIADSRGTSVHTVRNQVKAALLKTGSRRQADLSRLVEALKSSPTPGKQGTE